MKYKVIAQNEHVLVLEAENLSRDGDWVMLNKMVEQMEPRRFPDPSEPSGHKEVMVSNGRKVAQPIALFYRPITVEVINTPQESSNGNDA